MNLLLVAVVTLGRAAHFFVAGLTGVLVSTLLVNSDLCRLTFVTLGAVTKLLTMSFVVEGNGALLVLVSDNVSSDSYVNTDESQDHHDQYQFLHVSSSQLDELVQDNMSQFV